MRFIVYGAGAIGGVSGGRLAEHGHDVVLIARGEHYRALRANGLTLESPDATVTLDVPVVDHPSAITITTDDVVIFAGPDLHFVQYPLRGGELYNQVAVFRSRRFMPGSDDWGSPEEMDEAFACTCAFVRQSLRSILRNRRWPMVHRHPIANWTRGRVTLVGDAAHPMLQYVAQGACQAIEDAACLAQQLAMHGEDYALAFSHYQAARYLRTARVQTTAGFFGDYVLHLHGVGAVLRNAMLAPRKADDYSVIDWLYGYDACETVPASGCKA